MSINVREAVVDCLEGTLSPEGEIRRGAEERLKALEVIDNYGIILLEIVLDQHQVQPAQRQLAAVLLKHYVDQHWTTLAEKYVPPVPSDQIKHVIRENVIQGLQDSQSKIRNSIASVVSTIAYYDWPENWDTLFEILMKLLKEENGVEGSMRVMTEFLKCVNDEHAYKMAPIVLPEMLNISKNNSYSMHTRSRAVSVLKTFIKMIVTLAEMDKAVLKNLLDPILPSFMEIFVCILVEDNPPSIDDNCLKKEIVRTISLLVRRLPKRMTNYLPNLLRPIEGILVNSMQIFKEKFQENTDDHDYDSEGEYIGRESVILAIFELIQVLIDVPSNTQLRDIIKNGLNDLLYYTIFYMQLPQERVESWCENIASFAVDEDEDQVTYSLRVSAQDFLLNAFDVFPDECLVSLEHTLNKFIKEDWNSNWRLQEASLYAVSSLGTRLAKVGQDKPGRFDIIGFIQNIVIPLLNSQDQLLVGRCLVLGSNFSSVLNETFVKSFVYACVECLSPDKSGIIKILSAKAISIFVEQKENAVIKQSLLENLPTLIDPLIEFGITNCVEILSGVLDTIEGILQIDDNFTASIGQKIITLVISCFVKYHGDIIISPTIEEIVRALCKNPQCVLPLQERFTPTIVSVLNSRDSNLSGPQGVALDLLIAIVRASPVPLNPILINQAFPAVIHCVNSSTDHSVLQNSGECLRAYTAISPLQVFEFRDVSGMNGLNFVVQVACRLLDPATSEFSASFVGKLVTTLILKTGDYLGEQLDLLLRAVLSKLQSSDTLSVIQNLLMVYAHLFNERMEESLKFLDAVPGPTGNSALHFVLSEWMQKQHLFFGQFDRKISSIALAKLLMYGIQTQDKRLSTIMVKGDRIFDPNEKVLTRSKSKGLERWTEIPLFVKIFKLLINELATQNDIFDNDYETQSEEDIEEENENSSEFGPSQSQLNTSGNSAELNVADLLFDEDSEYHFDEDDNKHPLFEIQLENYLKDFLQSLSQQSFFSEFAQHCSQDETKILQTIGIGVPTTINNNA